MQTTPLYWAVSYNQIYAVELLLRNGADPNFSDERGFTPFLVAIQRCFPITAAYLIAKGTDVNQRVQGACNETRPVVVMVVVDTHVFTEFRWFYSK